MLSAKERIDVLIEAWKEVNLSIRDAVQFRWNVTLAFLTVMSAICYAAAQASKAQAWACGVSTLGCILALVVQVSWQHSYGRLVRRWVVVSDELAVAIRKVAGKDNVDLPIAALVSPKDAAHGLWGIYLVSALVALAACTWLASLALKA